jgi:hypothetical protein
MGNIWVKNIIARALVKSTDSHLKIRLEIWLLCIEPVTDWNNIMMEGRIYRLAQSSKHKSRISDSARLPPLPSGRISP